MEVGNLARQFVLPHAAHLVAHVVVHQHDTDAEAGATRTLTSLLVFRSKDLLLHHVGVEAAVGPQSEGEGVPVLRGANFLLNVGDDVPEVDAKHFPILHRVHDGYAAVLQGLGIHLLQRCDIKQLPILVILCKGLQRFGSFLGCVNQRNLLLLVVDLDEFLGQLLDESAELRQPRLLLGAEVREILWLGCGDVPSVVVHIDVAIALRVQEPVPLPLFVGVRVDALVLFLLARALLVKHQVRKGLFSRMVLLASRHGPCL
mmetsp:Transcript_58269/g.125149  ORF Transcript_58269/g.125149 Transcript_58269/m.125149 type:complete len:259 (+) Transcript_58269:127-903(+)